MESTASSVELAAEAVPCPFPSWSTYLPDLPYSPTSHVLGLLPAVTAFLRASAHLVTTEHLWERRSFPLHLPELLGESEAAAAVQEAWPGLAEELEEQPEQVLGVFGLARHHMVVGEGGVDQALPVVR